MALSWPPTFEELSKVNISGITTRTIASVNKEMLEGGHKVIPLSLEAALYRAGYSTVGSIVHSNPTAVSQVKGVGPKRLNLIDTWRGEIVDYLLNESPMHTPRDVDNVVPLNSEPDITQCA